MKQSKWFHTLLRTGHNSAALVICGLLLALEPTASALLALNREATLNGLQLWRLITGHWVHLGLMHFLLNAAGLGLMSLIFFNELKLKLDIIAFVIISLSTSLMILRYSPQIAQYVGLSGVLHGYFVYYLARGFNATPWINLAAWVGISLKVFYEQRPHYDSSATAQLINGQVALDAHLYGYTAGSLLAAALLVYHYWHAKTSSRVTKK